MAGLHGAIPMPRFCLLIIVLAASSAFAQTQGQAARPNVLLICIDDLRPELGCYGEDHMVTPHLDQLAATARVFTRQYVQLPTCGASRYSLLTGHHPRFRGAWNNGAFNALAPNDAILTMPEAFRAAGYTTLSLGKVSHTPDGHHYTYQGGGSGEAEMPDAWDEVTGPTGKWQTGWNAFFAYADGTSRTERLQNKQPIPFAEAGDVDDHGYPDGLLADMAVQRLRAMKKDQPFFMAVGFFKPHLPFTAPKKYFELYDPARIPMAPRPDGDVDYDHQGGEFKRYSQPPGVAKGEATERHAPGQTHMT
jgi:arylsulfatase A-like enzyme